MLKNAPEIFGSNGDTPAINCTLCVRTISEKCRNAESANHTIKVRKIGLSLYIVLPLKRRDHFDQIFVIKQHIYRPKENFTHEHAVLAGSKNTFNSMRVNEETNVLSCFD